ncbi:hypothetical protein Bca4012_042989 [Brassica carinata]
MNRFNQNTQKSKLFYLKPKRISECPLLTKTFSSSMGKFQPKTGSSTIMGKNFPLYPNGRHYHWSTTRVFLDFLHEIRVQCVIEETHEGVRENNIGESVFALKIKTRAY